MHIRYNLLPLSAILVVLVSVFSGLSIAATAPLVLIAAFGVIGKNIELDFSDYKLEFFAIFLFAIISLQGVSPANSFKYLARVTLIALAAMAILRNSEHLEHIASKTLKYLTFAVFTSVAFIYFEIATGGLVSLTFRSYFQDADRQVFFLQSLDRGCAFISILSWVVIASLIRNKRPYLALLLYVLLLTLLPLTDSLSAFVGYVLAGIVFIFTRYIRFFRNPIIVSFIFILSALAMYIFAASLDAYSLYDKADFLPLSAKHRLFIWEFVANKIAESNWIGYGFAASRYLGVTEDQFVLYDGHVFNPLPLHPHNALLQFMLEGGVLGLLIFIVLGSKYIIQVGIDFDSTKPSRIAATAAGYSCFVTYYVVSMISFNFWQSWWILATAFIVIMHRLSVRNF